MTQQKSASQIGTASERSMSASTCPHGVEGCGTPAPSIADPDAVFRCWLCVPERPGERERPTWRLARCRPVSRPKGTSEREAAEAAGLDIRFAVGPAAPRATDIGTFEIVDGKAVR